MQLVETDKQIELKDYFGIIEDSLYYDLIQLSEKLKGLRVCHINATSYGGGVAEILHQLIPLANSMGVRTDWKIITAEGDFFDVTKKVHNALQGANLEISDEEWFAYKTCNLKMSDKFDPDEYDLIIVHDPQPAEMIACMEKGRAKWVWRCHIDTSEPNKKIASYFRDFLDLYDGSIFTLREYVFKGLNKNVYIIPPAVDPLSEKNRIISEEQAKKIVGEFGLDTKRPIITQVSRFDPWKDPKGVVDAYKIAKSKFPDLQLVYAGSLADDDPEAHAIFEDLENHTKEDKDIHLLTNFDGVSDLEINAFQTYSDIIIQKSTKEGFGLTVSEALWKETPVIGGDVGGIPSQIEDGKSGYLVSSSKECGEKIIYLLENKELAEDMGIYGKEVVRKNFLLPRLLRDELRVAEELILKEKIEVK